MGPVVTRAAAAAAAVLFSALLTGASAAAAAVHPAAAARAAAGGDGWGKVQEVAGTGAPNVVGDAEVEAVSCAAAGSCSAGGSYGNRSGLHAFVAGETNGTWGRAKEVAAALNTGGTAEVASVSCASAGNCGAGGAYTDSSGNSQAFVVNEVSGTWRKAKEIAAALSRGRFAAVNSVSCGSAGNCGAGGTYTDGSGNSQAFVASEVNGTWGKAKEIAGALNAGGYAQVYTVSCVPAGDCGAGGGYTDGSGRFQAFVVNEAGGIWGKPERVPGTAALNARGGAAVDSVSCASAGNCGAGGHYKDGSGRFQAFVVNEAGGIWGNAEQVPGTAAFFAGEAGVNSVSCASAGNCTAGGSYAARTGQQAFVADEKNGTWGTAHEVAAALNVGGEARITALSCASAGNCSAGGSYAGSSSLQAFVISEINSTWGTALEVPGTAALNTGGLAEVFALSCASARHCSAGGYVSHFGSRAFVVNQT